MKKITITYADSKNCPAITKTFCGKSLDEASVLAANYQSAHPELHEIRFSVKR